VAGYLRVAIGAGAHGRLEAERARYARFPAYARLFDAQGEAPGIAAEDPDGVPAAVAPYRAALDVTVVRGLPADDTPASWLAVARAAAQASAASAAR
jgi:hypothetical protein